MPEQEKTEKKTEKKTSSQLAIDLISKRSSASFEVEDEVWKTRGIDMNAKQEIERDKEYLVSPSLKKLPLADQNASHSDWIQEQNKDNDPFKFAPKPSWNKTDVHKNDLMSAPSSDAPKSAQERVQTAMNLPKDHHYLEMESKSSVKEMLKETRNKTTKTTDSVKEEVQPSSKKAAKENLIEEDPWSSLQSLKQKATKSMKNAFD
jgi:hypothetical protein